MTDNSNAGIAGKIIAVTGASGGIGEATARHLAERGGRVLVGARRTDRLEALTADLIAKGHDALFRPLDVTRRDSVTGFVDFAQQRFGAVSSDLSISRRPYVS